MSETTYASAQMIAEQYSGPYKLRSLDILHLATALHYKVDSIATFDKKLAAVAAAFGLEVLPPRS